MICRAPPVAYHFFFFSRSSPLEFREAEVCGCRCIVQQCGITKKREKRIESKCGCGVWGGCVRQRRYLVAHAHRCTSLWFASWVSLTTRCSSWLCVLKYHVRNCQPSNFATILTAIVQSCCCCCCYCCCCSPTAPGRRSTNHSLVWATSFERWTRR